MAHPTRILWFAALAAAFLLVSLKIAPTAEAQGGNLIAAPSSPFPVGGTNPRAIAVGAEPVHVPPEDVGRIHAVTPASEIQLAEEGVSI